MSKNPQQIKTQDLCGRRAFWLRLCCAVCIRVNPRPENLTAPCQARHRIRTGAASRTESPHMFLIEAQVC